MSHVSAQQNWLHLESGHQKSHARAQLAVSILMQSAETLCTTPTDWLRLEYLLGIAVSAQQELAAWSDRQKSHA